MILHTGMRTDIPAFYSQWLLNRLEAGYVLVRNPFDPSQVTRYRLSPSVVDLLCFCTKNPAPMLPYLEKLKSYGQYWFVTITPYGRDVEPNVPPAETVMESFLELSRTLGSHRVAWRYDPILIHGSYTADFHLQRFERMANKLSGATDTCVISFVDLYEKVKRNFSGLQPVSRQDRLLLTGRMADIARRCGMTLKTCGEAQELSLCGADTSGCMTVATFEKALGERLKVPRFQPQRKECACYLGNDIGAYHSCAHLCRYCYANDDAPLAQYNCRRHDPASPFLIGHSMPGDRIHEAKQESWIDRQLSFL